MMGMSVSLTAILPRVGHDDLARVVITVNEDKGFFSIVSVGHNNRAQGVIVEFSRGFINKVNVRITHKFEFCQAQCLLSDGVMDGILFGRREVWSEKRGVSFIVKFVVHQKIMVHSALWRRTMASFSCSLATSTWTACTAWCLGRAEVVIVGAPAVGGGMALGVFEPSQIFLHWKPRAVEGPLGLRQCRMGSKSSVRQCRLVCSW